jgi:hypothetical protein
MKVANTVKAVVGTSSDTDPLHCLVGLCYSLVPPTRIAASKQRQRKRQGVDELRETLHNLASLLLTNTTLRTVQQGSTEHWFFNNQQSISVGV